MKIRTLEDSETMAREAALCGVAAIKLAIEMRGEANIIVATGASQATMLSHLAACGDIDWQRVTGFHLDEYIGLPFTHVASFRNYLWSRFLRQLPVPMREFHFVNGEVEPEAECIRVGGIIATKPIDVAFVGIGENGHLAFNDPPADFETEEPYLCIKLDEACRRQQVGEGWFRSLSDVPERAITMSIGQILKSNLLVCTVPDLRKAEAVRNSVAGPVTPQVPASILQEHPDTTLYLDSSAASLLGN